MATKILRVFQEFTSEGYVPMPIAGNIDYGVTIAGTFPSTTPATFQTDDPDLEVTVTEVTDFYVWIRSHGTDWNYQYTRNVRVYPDSAEINNVVMGIIIANLAYTVPYEGATQDVDLGEFGITAGYVGLDLTPTNTPIVEGTMSWNDGDGTMDLIMKGGNVTQQVGQELLARAFNAEATTLVDGEMVYIYGSQGNRISVKRASNSNESSSSVTIGMVTETIASGAEGFVTIQGTVHHLNTTGLTAGSALWLGSTPGTYTQTKPQAPLHSVLVGYVERVHATVGSIYVKVQNGYELDELHNVKITSVANNQALIYDSAESVWKNRTLIKTNGFIPYFDSTDLLKNSPLFTDGTDVTINGFDVMVSDEATVNYVAKFGSTRTIIKSLLFDDGTKVGINKTNPQYTLDVTGSIGIYSSSTNYGFQDTANTSYRLVSANGFQFTANNIGTVAVTRVDSAGNWGFGIGTPAYKVDVSGDVNITGNYRVNNSLLTTSNIAEGTNLYFTSNRVLGQVLTGLNTSLTGLVTSADSLIVGISKLQNQVSSIVSGVSSVDGTANRISVNQTTGAVIVNIASTYVGQTSITTLGTISSGTWNGTAITDTYISSASNWNTAYSDRLKWDGGSTSLVASTGRTSLGATTVGSNLFTLTNPSAITFLRVNADNTVSALSASDFRTAIGAGTSSTTGTVTSVGLSSTTTGITIGSTPITTSGTITINIATASATLQGLLSSTDWNTFNNKQNALGYTPVPTTRTLTINGTAYDLSADRSWTVAGTISGLTTNYIPKATSATTIGNSLIYDNGTKILIGTTTASGKLTVVGSAGDGITYGDGTVTNYFGTSGGGLTEIGSLTNNAVSLLTNGSSKVYITANGNVLIGTTTNADSSLLISKTLASGTATTVYGVTQNGQVQSSVTASANGFLNSASTQASAFTLTNYRHFYANQGTLGVGSAITNQYGFFVESNLTSATNNYGFWGAIPSGTNRWNLYMSGTANNYLAGNLSIGTTTTTYKFNWASGSNFGFLDNYAGGAALGSTGGLEFYTGATPTRRVRILDTGEIGINTTAPLTALTVSGNLSLFTTNQIRLYNSAKNNWTQFDSPLIGGDAEVDLKITAKTGYVYVSANGSLGINTTNVQGALDVATTAQFVYGTTPTAGVKIGTQGTTGGSLMVQTASLSSTYGSGFAVDGTYSGGKSTIQLTAFGVYSGGPYSADMVFRTSVNTTISERMRITSGGNVGIGTTSPSSKLHVYGGDITFEASTSNANLTLKGSATNESTIYFLTGSTYKWNIGTSSNDLTFYKFQGGTGEAMRITSSGNVSIGNTNNTYKLDVSGTIKGTQYRIAPNGTSIVYNIVDSDATYAGVYSLQAGGGSAGYGGSLVMYGHAHATRAGYVSAGISSGSNGKFTVMSQANGSGSDLFVVQQDGKVGIGTTSPAYKLDVVGTSVAGSSDGIAFSNTTSTLGTKAAIAITSSTFSFGSLGGNTTAFFAAAGSPLTMVTTDANDFRILTNYSERFRVTSGGNVGIGTTSPSYLLHVKGSGAYNGAIFADNTGTTGGGSFQVGVNGTAVGSISSAGTFLGSTDQNMAYYAGTGLGHIFYSNGATERMRITSGGEVNIGGTPSTQLMFNVKGISGKYISFWTPTISGVNNNGIISHTGAGYTAQAPMGYFATTHVFNGEVTGGGAMQVSGDVNISGAFKINGTAIGTGGGGVSGSGNTNYISKWSGSTSLTNSLIRDDGGSQVYIEGSAVGNVSALNFNIGATIKSYIGVNTNDMYISNQMNNPMIFRTNATERMRLNESGILLVNATSSFGGNIRLQVNSDGTSAGIGVKSNNVLIAFFNTSNGGVGSISTNGTTTSYNTASDYRLKTDLRQFNGLSLLDRINVYDYAWKSNNTRDYGVMAHELQEVIPNAVLGIKDGKDMQGVDYSKVVPILVQSIKELKAELDTLKSVAN